MTIFSRIGLAVDGTGVAGGRVGEEFFDGGVGEGGGLVFEDGAIEGGPPGGRAVFEWCTGMMGGAFSAIFLHASCVHSTTVFVQPGFRNWRLFEPRSPGLTHNAYCLAR